MLRSMLSGISGLRAHQTRMDVIGNNIANVNTVAFNGSRATFSESFGQMMQNAARPQAGVGGRNPMQVGLGVGVGSIDKLFGQGTLESTGIKTDLAIQGDSFFVVGRGQDQKYTRAGNFRLDANGYLSAPGSGYVLQGRSATNGVLSNDVRDLRIPFDQVSPARATTSVRLGGNLDSSTPVGQVHAMSITVYDHLGDRHELRVDVERTGDNEWAWSVDDSTIPGATGNGTFIFTEDGLLDHDASELNEISFTPAGATQPVAVTLDPGTGLSGLAQFASSTSAVIRDGDGYPMGELDDFNIDPSGTITGTFSNGEQLILGQIALADFGNPEGLNQDGDNLYSVSGNSGEPVITWALDTTDSSIQSRALEMSNVDLASEFTGMITSQRGFQAASRVITTADEMLQEVVNLRR